jgi:hypothetical protein
VPQRSTKVFVSLWLHGLIRLRLLRCLLRFQLGELLFRLNFSGLVAQGCEA